MLWDLLFGSYFRDRRRRPPADIGIREFMPPRFVHQLLWPFLTDAGKQRIAAEGALGILRRSLQRT